MAEALCILVVDDDPDAVLLLKEAFSRTASDVVLASVSSGTATLEYLGSAISSGATPLPALLLLDIKMPGLSGFDVLEWLREHPSCRPSQVIVYSASVATTDRSRAEALGADGYLVKPGTFQELLAHTRLLADMIRTGTHSRLD